MSANGAVSKQRGRRATQRGSMEEGRKSNAGKDMQSWRQRAGHDLIYRGCILLGATWLGVLSCAGMATGADGVPSGGRGHATAVELGLAAQPLPCRLRKLPGEESAAALAVGPQALLGRAAGR